MSAGYMFAYLVSISGASVAPAVALIGARYWLWLMGVSSVRFFLMSFNPRLCVFWLLICKCFLLLMVAYWLRLRLLGLLIGRGSGGQLRRVLNPIIFFRFHSAVNILLLYRYFRYFYISILMCFCMFFTIRIFEYN